MDRAESKGYLALLSLFLRTTRTMHSKLDLHKHISCEDLILQLDQCHTENFLNRYLGRCNKLKRAMNECLQAEFDINRKIHFEKAKERRKRYEETWKGMEE